ncbi:DUF3107 domain-containing protein [Pseudarthrobacter sp. AG30]|uniref:DUF3107 domain-containing protein n=1 Tax=Micrococcaceae TaxID=1268 RepID=UPI0003675967|nr:MULTISPECIES: DUF3107 domain-containing protein [Micrococcaceae]RAX15585.1 DUF3107 domain-containing protein [Pseudarthrobacter sp. AG30]TDT82601.1 uncharacterized protein DUF3107 [Arthrobacter sp. AG258]
MEIKIGVQNVGREIVLESDQDAETVAKTVGEAINDGTQLRLKDDKGRLIIVPGNALAYVEIGAEEVRRVGFGQF